MSTIDELAPQQVLQPALPRYELRGNAAADLAEQLLTLHPPTSSHRFVCYLLSGTGPFADLGRTVELDVFGEVFASDRAEMDREYGPYEDASRFFVVMDQHRRRAAGVLRVIGNSPAGLKTLHDIADPLRLSAAQVQEAHDLTDLERCWDVGTLAVLPEYRRVAGRTVSLMLYRALYVFARQLDVDHVVTIMDRHAHRVLLMLGIPLVPICGGEAFDYLGTPCTPLYGTVADLPSSVRARSRRLLARSPLVWLALAGPMRKLSGGRGLDDRMQPRVD